MNHKIEFWKIEWPIMTHTGIFAYDVMITDWSYGWKPTGTNKYSRYGGNRINFDLQRSFQPNPYVFILIIIWKIGFTSW